MYIACLFGYLAVLGVLLIANHRRRILFPKELLRVACRIDSSEMVILSQVARVVKTDHNYDLKLWTAMGRTLGLLKIAYNAGCIASTSRYFLRLSQNAIQSEHSEICQRAVMLRVLAFRSIPEILLNACHIPHNRLHTRKVAYLYSQITVSLRTQFEEFCPELLSDLGDVL